MKLKKRLISVLLLMVFVIGAAAGAIGTNMMTNDVSFPTPIQGDSADLTPVETSLADAPVCPEVLVCPDVEPELIKAPEFREISMQEVQNMDFSVFGPEYSNFPELIPERDSPSDYVKEYQIHIYPNQVVIDIQQPILAAFADTNSMDPVFDARHNAIEIVPQKESDIQVGDIVSYSTDYGSIIHRVKEIGQDEDGWYAVFKGDNNPVPDPGRIRFDQINRKAIAFIY
jgi:hypothetical protein